MSKKIAKKLKERTKKEISKLKSKSWSNKTNEVLSSLYDWFFTMIEKWKVKAEDLLEITRGFYYMITQLFDEYVDIIKA